ncbi:hypothetical protein MSAN_00331400 [Mycena sanguinolenta]|uniref:C2H2-type domain-containing protein n=1 Tax=Mycena sanguinolenta TaxID=230812 RepID=A0A8H7DKD6_9AGAR|nr:hypothetical protein MSAN_00331400 [Mycena sanguinolenta]
MASGSPSININGGKGGDGGDGGVQGGGGGPGQGLNFGGNMHVVFNNSPNPGSPTPSQAEAASSQSSASGSSASGTPDTEPAVHHESETYCSELLRQGRGFPLFVPQPQSNRPVKWREKGIAIGDVGRITERGSFDFFFNIYLPADNPINANVPEDFDPLVPDYDPIDLTLDDYSPGNYVCSRHTVTHNEVNDQYQEFPGRGFLFSCQQHTGAVLTLPHGAHLEKLENLESMRRYAEKHAESWYKYVKVTRGRRLANGHLYIITGWEKAKSWGIAYFRDVSLQSKFKLSFAPTADAANGYKYRWNGDHCHYKQADAPLVNETPLNQTTFIHTFAISIGECVWEELFGVKVCEGLNSSGVPDKSSDSSAPHQSQGFSSWCSSIFTRGSAYGGGGGRQATSSAPGGGIVTDAFPILQITHPSQIIHQHILREAPQAKVVITHDDAWRDVFKEDGARTSGQTPSELQQAIFDRFEIVEVNGAASLRAKSDPATARNVATITVEESCPMDGQITNDPRDDLILLFQRDLREISDEVDCNTSTVEGDIRPNSPHNARVQLDPVFDMWNLPSPRDHPRTRLSSYSDHSEPSFVDQWRSPGIEIPQISLDHGCREFTMSGGGSMDGLVSVGLSSSRSVVLTDAEEAELYNIQNRNTGTKSVFGMQYPSPIHPAGRGGFGPNQYQAPPDAQYGNPNAGSTHYGHEVSILSTPARRYEHEYRNTTPGRLPGLQLSNSYSSTIRPNSFTGGYPIPPSHLRTHTDTTQSRSRLQFNLQSHQLMGSVEDAFSPVALSIPSSPTHSSHDPHSPVPPWSGAQFLAPPAWAFGPHVQSFRDSDTSSNQSSSPNLDFSAVSFDFEGALSKPQDNSLHRPMLMPPAWDPNFLAPDMMYKNADTASLFSSDDASSVGPLGPNTEWDFGSTCGDVYAEDPNANAQNDNSPKPNSYNETERPESHLDKDFTERLQLREGPSMSIEAGRRAARRKGPARFFCEYPRCDATFTAKHNLRSMSSFLTRLRLADLLPADHLKSHTSTKDYICEMCDRGFGTKHVLKRHERKCNARRNPSGRSSKASYTLSLRAWGY